MLLQGVLLLENLNETSPPRSPSLKNLERGKKDRQ